MTRLLVSLRSAMGAVDKLESKGAQVSKFNFDHGCVCFTSVNSRLLLRGFHC